MSDLFDLPFEDDYPSTVDSHQSTVDSRQAPSTDQPTVRDSSDGRPSELQPAPAPSARAVLTVTELTVRLRDLIESQFFEVWVEGELSNCKAWNTGHLYF